MPNFLVLRNRLISVTVLVLLLFASTLHAQTTTFDYQGRLLDAGTPANGNYDLQFALFGLLSGGSQIGSTQTRTSVAVSGGVFSVALDFGANAFSGEARFLEIGVRPHSSDPNIPPYTVLVPRQQITSMPYALQSDTAHVAEVPTSQGPQGPPGPAGPPGPQGVTGPAGPILSTVAVCYAGNASLPCSRGSVAAGDGGCTAVSSTGSCNRITFGNNCDVCKAFTPTVAICGTSSDCNCPFGSVVVRNVTSPCAVTSSSGSCSRITTGGVCCVCVAASAPTPKRTGSLAIRNSRNKVRRSR